jgi:hypothetical protein
LKSLEEFNFGDDDGKSLVNCTDVEGSFGVENPRFVDDVSDGNTCLLTCGNDLSVTKCVMFLLRKNSID